jgi:hypothetical protein
MGKMEPKVGNLILEKVPSMLISEVASNPKIGALAFGVDVKVTIRLLAQIMSCCKAEGHIASSCPKAHGCSLQMCGFGFLGQGFYNLKIPDTIQAHVSEYVGLITIVSG